MPGSHELSRQVTELLLRPENVTTDGDTETGTAGGYNIRRWECGWAWGAMLLHAAKCGPEQQEGRIEAPNLIASRELEQGRVCESLPFSPRVSPAVRKPWPSPLPFLNFALDRGRLHKHGVKGRGQLG